MPQFADFEQARAWLAEHPQVRYVDLLLPDQMGIPRGKRVTVAELEGVHENGLLLPASMLLGGVLLLAADSAARTLAAPAELPIGIVTAIVGAPFFLVLLLRQRTLVGL